MLGLRGLKWLVNVPPLSEHNISFGQENIYQKQLIVGRGLYLVECLG